MTVQDVSPGQSVAVEFGHRQVEGTVLDVRWRPSFNNPVTEIVVDANGTTITTGRASITPR